MLKRGSILWLIWNAIVAILLGVAGVATLINHANPDFQSVIILIVGIFFIVDAALRLFFDVFKIIRVGEATIVSSNAGAAIAAAFEISIGIALFILSDAVKANNGVADFTFGFIGRFIGISLITIGGVLTVYTVLFFIKKIDKLVLRIALAILAALAIGGGVFVLIYLTDQSTILNLFFIVFGLVLVLVATALLAGTIAIFISAKKHEKAVAEVGEEDIVTTKEDVVEEPQEEPQEETGDSVEETPAE